MNRDNTSPILIYQMGKVGSKTVEATLKHLGLPNRIYHAHFLSWSGIEEVERYYAGCGQPRRLDHSRKIREFLDNNPTLRCKVITLVRDYVSREVSDVFENIQTTLPAAVEPRLSPSQSQDMIEQYLTKLFGGFNAETDYACTWFDKELKDVFGFDIFAVPFDAQRGYQIYSTARADILCIRLEDLSRVYQVAFRDFLGVSIPQLVIDNEGSDKQSKEIYQQIKQQFRVPESVLEPIYQSRLLRHFYTDDEIASFKGKWLKPTLKTEHSQQTGRILLIHSEGNVNNNPNLSGLVEILCEQGYQVDIASPRRKGIVQKSPHPNACLLLVDDKRAKVAGELVLLAGKPLSTAQEIASAVGAIDPYDFIFGVDRAIIEASIIAHARNIPYGLISYEIFFAEEAGADYKEPEITACRDIAFAVCQDPVRGGCLSRENRIPLDKMIYIPVAGRGIVPRQKSCALHQKLGIDPARKIAIYCGNVDSYCMIDELIQSAAAWPDDWVLVIHNRYGLDKKTLTYYEQYGGSDKILFSREAVDTPDQMHTLLSSAEIGIAFYRPMPNNKWIGNNIRYIGLASGKISTYLQHGLPILINELGQISDYVRQYKLGIVHAGTSGIKVPSETELKLWAHNTQSFFSGHFDLNKTVVPLLEKLSAILQLPRHVEVVSQHTESKGNRAYLVSAIVSTYNSEAFIRGCLQDLVEQTLYQKGQLEIVVVNSGSQQNEEAVVKEYQSRYPHIQYIKTSQRETIYAAWNRGIRAAHGRYITNANTDDRHAPEMMEKQAAALEQNPDVAGVYSYFHVTPTPNQTWQTRTVEETRTWHPPYSHQNLLRANFMGPFPMWRRSLHDEYGWFDPALKVAGDYEFFLRVSQTHPMMLIPEPLGLYYYNPSSLERSAGTRDQEDEWIKQLYRESRGRVIRRPFYPAGEDLPSPESQRNYLLAGALKLFQKAQKAFAAGNMLTARKVMAQYQTVMNYDHLPRIDRRDNTAGPLMSVVIVTYQRSEDVAKLLDCFQRQTNRDFETIVVDNGGTDINAITGRADCIIPCPINFNLSEGRNIGACFARGKIIVFVDDDALVDADYTASVHHAFQTYNVLGLRGRTLPKTPVSNKHISICDRGDKPFPTLCNQEGNSAFLLWAWRAVGGQDPLLFGHEGTDLTWRLIHAFGRRDAVMYWPGTVIYHDYGDGGKTRRKRQQQEINQDYLLYKYDESISDIRLQLEALPLAEGNALSAQPVVPAEAGRWYGLRYQDNLEKLDAMSSPKVSVIIACYNMAEYLPQCLDGIRAQTIRNWETVIVDDGSTDGSREILQQYSQMDKRFRVFYFDKSEGPYVRRNFAIQRARAPFISIQDADDILAPQKLEMLLEEILKDNSLGVVGSFFGRFIDTFRGPEYCDRLRLQVSHAEIVKTYQNSFYVCWHASAIIRKTLFEQVGLYDCQPWGSDTFWLAKAAMYGILTGKVRFKNLPEILTYKREHKKSQTGTILLNHPNGRRKVLSRYGQQKLLEIAQQARQNPGLDVGQAIRNCNCNDFIPRFGHLFEQWESGAVTQQMIAGLLSKAMHEFCSGYCSDCLISLNSLCDVCKGVEKQLQGLNLLRGLCQFIAGEDELARLSLRQEYTDHGTVQAGDFLNRCLTQTNNRPGGIQRRQIVDRFIYIDTLKSSIEPETIYDNRDASAPKVSVILDCRRGTVDLETVIAEWTAQADKHFELLILTTGNSKADFAGQTLPLRSAVINFTEGTSGAAVKNRAVSFARGEILLFAASHVAVRPDCIAVVRDALNTPAIGAVSGRILSISGGWNTNLDYGDRKLFCCLDHDFLCAVKRQVFERAGGLEEGIWGREMLSLSWAIYDGSDTDFGSILYVPGLAGTWRPDVPVTTDFVLRQLAADQLYWRRSCPGKYWGFIGFAERCVWTNDESSQYDPGLVAQVVQFFTGKHRAIALQWARLAYRLKSDRLSELFSLASCEWDAGNIEQAVGYYKHVLAIPFLQRIETQVFSFEERNKIAEVIKCYITTVLRLAEYYQAGGQTSQAQQMLSGLKANSNCILDAEQQQQFDRLYQGVQTGTGKTISAVPSSRSDRPRVSVIMPAYNSAAYIDTAIQSVLAQTYPNFELILVNDGSTDNTEQVIQNYRDNRIRCFSQTNAGLAATRNTALRHATGQFIIPLDDDDRMKPEFIEQHVAAFERHPEADLIYCDDHLVNEAGKSIRVIRRKDVSDPTQLVCGLFQGGFPFIPFRTCIRRSVFDKIGLYDEALRVAEDYDMIRRFAAKGLIAKHLPGDFYIRQIRTDSLSRNHTRQKALTHFGVIRQFIETFSWEQLFPDANWNELSPAGREFQGRYLSASVFQAIGRNYIQNKTPGFYADVAMDFEIEQLEHCLELSPDNREVIQRIETCRQRKSQFSAGVLV